MLQVKIQSKLIGDYKKYRIKCYTIIKLSAAAEGMQILAASGQNANNIMKLTPGLLTLMSAGSVDANTAAKALTGTMAQFNMRAEESDRIIDSLAKGAASANTNVGEIQEALKMGGGDMANMNMTVEQATAMVGVLADINIVGLIIKLYRFYCGPFRKKFLNAKCENSENTKLVY